MKSIILSFLLLSTTVLSLFPFVAFSRSSTTFTFHNNPSVLPTTHDNNNNDVVLDTDGKPVKINEEYMILSISTGGGKVYLADLENTKCPNGVVQDNSGHFEHGTPVKFFNMQLGSYVVYENQDINIMFSSRPTSKLCVNETVWKVGDNKEFVVTGGTLGIPGPNTLNSWFKIEKYETMIPHSYNLRYCPSQDICPDCHFNCADIGLISDSGYDRLALNNKPYPFRFTKINKNHA